MAEHLLCLIVETHVNVYHITVIARPMVERINIRYLQFKQKVFCYLVNVFSVYIQYLVTEVKLTAHGLGRPTPKFISKVLVSEVLTSAYLMYWYN